MMQSLQHQLRLQLLLQLLCIIWFYSTGWATDQAYLFFFYCGLHSLVRKLVRPNFKRLAKEYFVLYRSRKMRGSYTTEQFDLNGYDALLPSLHELTAYLVCRYVGLVTLTKHFSVPHRPLCQSACRGHLAHKPVVQPYFEHQLSCHVLFVP